MMHLFGRKGLRLFSVLLSLVLLLGPTPTLEAFAAEESGPSVCTHCGENSGELRYYDESSHAWYCTNSLCSYYNMAYSIEEHTGGTATCTSGPICAVCGEEYGEPDLENHDWGEWTDAGDDMNHTHTCMREGCGATETEAHFCSRTFCGLRPKCDICGADFGDPVDHEMYYEDRGENGHKPYCYHCDTLFLLEDHVPDEPQRDNVVPATCTTDGSYDEVVYCKLCGAKISEDHVTVPAGHSYFVSSRTITRITYQCRRCRHSYWIDNPASNSLIPDLVRDENGENVDYTAKVFRKDGKRILTVTPVLQGEENARITSLYLKPEYIEQWMKDGVITVRFQRNKAVLEIVLAEITLDWFTFDANAGAVDFFVFTLDPADEEVLIAVYALIGEERTPADTFTGVTLNVGKSVMDVKANGVYKIKK